MPVVGPGTSQQTVIAPDPMLQGIGDDIYVTILNPLSDDWQVQVAQDVPINVPLTLHSPTSMTQNERDVTSQYGLSLKNPDHKQRQAIFNTTIIPSGQTMTFKGSDAQVIVRQLVNEIAQREGRVKLMTDPNVRNEIEQRIVKRMGSMQDIMDGGIVSQQQQIDAALNKTNEVVHEPFPGLQQGAPETAPRSTDTGSTSVTPPQRNTSSPATA